MKEYMMRVSEETHAQIVEMAKKDFRKIGQEMAYMIDFAYKNMDNKAIQMINAMTPQKGMTEEDVRQTPAYKELEEELDKLKKENYELGDSDLSMNEIMKLSEENKRKQDDVQNKMRAMINI